MAYFEAGEHLRTWCGGFWHHGIAFGDGRIIHMSGLSLTNGKASATVRWGTEERFASGGIGTVEVVEYGACDPPEVVLRRAVNLLGRGGYNVVNNNCENVARYCKTGQWQSEQVTTATAVGGGVLGGAGVAAAGIGAVTAAGASGPAIMSGLAGAGSVFGGGAMAGVVVTAAGPAAVATVAVHHAYRDDAALTQGERAARAKARAAGTLGAIGGTVGTVAAVSAAGVPGLSAIGITTGLTAIGGSMLGGLAVLLGAPVLVAGACALIAHRSSRR